MAVPVPKGDDFGRKNRSRRTLVMAVVFVLYLVLGGVVFSQLEVYEKERALLRPTLAWRSLQGKTGLGLSTADWTEFRDGFYGRDGETTMEWRKDGIAS